VPTVLPPHVPLTGPAGPPPTQPFAFSRLVNGLPVRWNPCVPIRYVANLGGYDDSFRPVIAEAVERVEAATGLTFVPVGDTNYMPTLSNGGQFPTAQADLVIALGDEIQSDLVPGSVVGKAGIIFFAQTILRASVIVDMGGVGANPPWSSVGAGPVLMHELAHAVGLDHVNDTSQLMNSFASASGPQTYGAGDLTGLWQVGSAAGCF